MSFDILEMKTAYLVIVPFCLWMKVNKFAYWPKFTVRHLVEKNQNLKYRFPAVIHDLPACSCTIRFHSYRVIESTDSEGGSRCRLTIPAEHEAIVR